MFDGAATRRFDIAFDIDGGASRVRSGVSAALTIAGAVFEDVLHVPKAAVFDVSGQPSVYVKTGAGFEPKPVKVRVRTDTLAVVEGIEQPADVALVNPSAGARSAGRPGAAAPVVRGTP